MGTPVEEYERLCAKCWEEHPGEGWFRKTFPMMIGLTERRALGRCLCPTCAGSFDDDAARIAFLASTLPRRYVRLPGD